MTGLASKRVLLLAPTGQHSSGIAQAIVAQGGEADLFEERPSLRFWGKVLVRYFPRLSYFLSQPYFRKILAACRGKRYDYVLIIRGEAVTRTFLLDLKRSHPNARVILYQWDSLSLTRGPVDKLDLFDVLVSFDKKDCATHSMAFLPLFYLEEYRAVSYSRAPVEYDFSFIGTIHSDRYRVIRQIRRLADAGSRATYFYMYLTSYAGFYKQKYFDRNLAGASRSEFHFVPLPKPLALDVTAKSRIVVDAEHPAQTGLTMRTLEMLGAKKKLITTNADVMTYDFYRPDNILVVDRNDVVVPDSFITQGYVELDEETYEKYSVGSWVRNLFSLAEKTRPGGVGAEAGVGARLSQLSGPSEFPPRPGTLANASHQASHQALYSAVPALDTLWMRPYSATTTSRGNSRSGGRVSVGASLCRDTCPMTPRNRKARFYGQRGSGALYRTLGRRRGPQEAGGG